jgi:hypothetical protein
VDDDISDPAHRMGLDASHTLPSEDDLSNDLSGIKDLPILSRRLRFGWRRKGGRGVGRVINRTGTCALILPTPTEMRVSVSENFKIWRWIGFLFFRIKNFTGREARSLWRSRK